MTTSAIILSELYAPFPPVGVVSATDTSVTVALFYFGWVLLSGAVIAWLRKISAEHGRRFLSSVWRRRI